MANFKAVVRGERKDGFMQVYIRVTHRRVHGYIKTDKMITKKELSKSKEIKDPFVLNWCSERMLEFNDRLNKKDISRWTAVSYTHLAQVREHYRGLRWYRGLLRRFPHRRVVPVRLPAVIGVRSHDRCALSDRT